MITLFLARPSAIIQSGLSGRRSLGSRRHSCAIHNLVVTISRCTISNSFVFTASKCSAQKCLIHNLISWGPTYLVSQFHPRRQSTTWSHHLSQHAASGKDLANKKFAQESLLSFFGCVASVFFSITRKTSSSFFTILQFCWSGLKLAVAVAVTELESISCSRFCWLEWCSYHRIGVSWLILQCGVSGAVIWNIKVNYPQEGSHIIISIRRRLIYIFTITSNTCYDSVLVFT